MPPSTSLPRLDTASIFPADLTSPRWTIANSPFVFSAPRKSAITCMAAFSIAGSPGKIWIAENEADVIVLCDLQYSKATSSPTRWVLVVPEDSPVRTVQDLEGKRIATEAVGLTRRYLESRGVNAIVEFSWGATEVKVPELVDAIVDITETGSSLRANNLRIVDELMQSYPAICGQPNGVRGSVEAGEDGTDHNSAPSGPMPGKSGVENESPRKPVANGH